MTGHRAERTAVPGRDRLRTILAALLTIATVAVTADLVPRALSNKQIEADIAELNDVRYGLLDAHLWVEQIDAIVGRRVDDFELSDKSRPVVKARIEQLLLRLVDEVEAYRSRTTRGEDSVMDWLVGELRREARRMVIDFDELRAGVPQFADAMLDELQRPRARAEIKQLVTDAMRSFAASTFSRTDRTAYEAIMTRHECNERRRCTDRLAARVASGRESIRNRTLVVIGLVIAVFTVCRLRAPPLGRAGLAALTIATITLLAGGISVPMIGIEAKVAKLSLEVLGEPVVFENQVLYYQSKSVLEVATLLLGTGELDLVFVAGLVMLFSVAFPAAKVVAGVGYYLDVGRLRTSRVARFFALESGKWSMADVMVVTLFMAYIGFRGLVSSQLDEIGRNARQLEVLTTNGTSLQAGFWLFLGFCLAGMTLSTLLERAVEQSAD